MKTLVFTPLHPDYGIRPLTQESIMALEYDRPFTRVFAANDNPTPSWERGGGNYNITHNYNHARHIALFGGYDALLTIEADMVVSPLALAELVEAMETTGAQVIYGLYVFRQLGQMNLALKLTKVGKELATPEYINARLEETVPCVGLGLGCTLIHRDVLGAFPFRLYDEAPGMLACDWRFAIHCQEAGFKQVMNLAVHCGHITHDGRVLWPADYLYKEINYVYEIA
jgi:GT2 family glycosyltransferase